MKNALRLAGSERRDEERPGIGFEQEVAPRLHVTSQHCKMMWISPPEGAPNLPPEAAAFLRPAFG